ncbi:ABC transporter permease [Aquihabitans sp. McL0605]|uniref:ABC transporter permease n=1 Tax=Aquihabitans sp. McL0605 TaxID=3415671 RepID=UPI003CE8B137
MTSLMNPPEAIKDLPPRQRFADIPRWAKGVLYICLGVGVLSLTRVLTGAGQLTAENTMRSALYLALPIALAGLGGLWSERAGVVNIGLEGMMVLGTWFGAYGGIAYGPWQGIALGIVGGAVGGLLHALATVVFGVDHIISGVAINLLAVGFCQFLTSVSWNGVSTRESPTIPSNVGNVDLLPFLNSPLRTLSGQHRFFLSDLSSMVLSITTHVSLLTILALLLFPLTYLILWRTPFGLRLRSVGEDPDAADSLGVNVYRMKFVAVTISGALSGLAGVVLVYLFSGKFQDGQTGGRGFIGLAAMIFGNWRPGGLLVGAGLFGFMDSMQSQVTATSHALLIGAALAFVITGLACAWRRLWVSTAVFALLAAGCAYWYQTTDELPSEIIPYFPHVTTLLVLVFASQRLRPPAADGKVWRRGGR